MIAPCAGRPRRALALTTFRSAGLDTPELDARLLIGHALGLDHAGARRQRRPRAAAPRRARIEALAARRLGGEPVARIIGIKEFWGLPLRVTPATLVPRPDTETVVEAALAAIDAGGPRSGAAHRRPRHRLRRAAARAALRTAERIRHRDRHQRRGARKRRATTPAITSSTRARDFVACDFGAALGGGFDLVVVNPPYVASGDIGRLAAEVRHDPRAGARRRRGRPRLLSRDCRRRAAPHCPDGHIVVELGIGQEAAVAALFQAAGLEAAPARHDLSGIARALTARVAIMPP